MANAFKLSHLGTMGRLASVVIPNSVTAIGASAFAENWKLTKLTLPTGLTKLNDTVFHNLIGLTSITLPTTLMETGTRGFTSSILKSLSFT